MWWGDLAEDQRPTDIYSQVYDTEPLGEDLEILGFPAVRLNASSDAPLVARAPAEIGQALSTASHGDAKPQVKDGVEFFRLGAAEAGGEAPELEGDT